MQTFLPYENFSQSAAVLDRQRLGKQRVEVLQILRTLRGETSGWQNHPAVKMWRGYESALILYGEAVCNEWLHRGYQDSTKEKILSLGCTVIAWTVFPAWLGNADFHRSHRRALLAKNWNHYAQFWPEETPEIAYIWPKGD